MQVALARAVGVGVGGHIILLAPLALFRDPGLEGDEAATGVSTPCTSFPYSLLFAGREREAELTRHRETFLARSCCQALSAQTSPGRWVRGVLAEAGLQAARPRGCRSKAPA